MNGEKAILVSLTLVSVMLFSFPIPAKAQQRNFEIFVDPPTERIVSMGGSESFTVQVYNHGELADNYEFTLRSSPSSGARENWPASIRDDRLEIGPGESETTTITVKVPENVVDYSQNLVDIICTNSRGVKGTQTIYVGAEPPSVYNETYILTGIAVIIVGIIIVILRWRGVL